LKDKRAFDKPNTLIAKMIAILVAIGYWTKCCYFWSQW